MPKSSNLIPQIALRNNIIPRKTQLSLKTWLEFYLKYEVTTLPSSRQVQYRDLNLFVDFFLEDTGSDNLTNWTPRLSTFFKSFLQKRIDEDGNRHWNDRTVNRILTHLKTFAKFINKHLPFPLGNPMEKIKLIPTASLLSVERALTQQERRRLLDSADILIQTGGKSRDRNRYKNSERPTRKGYRPYRNRAIIYTLIETGMRRSAIVNIRINDVDFKNNKIKTLEKGSVEHSYQISQDGLKAIQDYIKHERPIDATSKQYTLFLPANILKNPTDKLHPNTINDIWISVCKTAGISGKTPHSARHAMGRYIIEKTGNIAAVQRQLGHKNAQYSLQYSRITSTELNQILNERE
ncbi:MAG: site-specific integrase [Spirochaetes bacterium]|nr:site-specific integrase [Spirochaetota bacterium]